MRIEHLSLAYPPNPPVISGISTQLPLPGVYALMGPSGLGKTSLLKAIAGLLTPAEGRITGLEGLRISMLFQENRLLPWRTALQNVLLGMTVPDEGRAKALLHALQIEELPAFPAVLSGGMQRRVALARALAHGGDVLLLDEPFTGLDEELKQVAAQLILQQQARLVLFSSHELQDCQMMGARRLQLHADRIELVQEITQTSLQK